MTICPVCEHPQEQGNECDACGKVFAAVAAVPVVVTRMIDVEATPYAEAGGPVAVEPLSDLEQTRMAAGGPDLPPVAVPELERTELPAAGPIVSQVMPEIDLGRELDSGPRTAAPLPGQPCRYCKHVQASGSVCERCGMRLPRAALPAASAGRRAGSVAGVPTRCKSCGAPARSGTPCGDCGRDVTAPDA